MRMPSESQMGVAIEWLLNNEGEGFEGLACKAVAAWIEYQDRERTIRESARAAGVTVARFRRKLAETQANQ